MQARVSVLGDGVHGEDAQAHDTAAQFKAQRRFAPARAFGQAQRPGRAVRVAPVGVEPLVLWNVAAAHEALCVGAHAALGRHGRHDAVHGPRQMAAVASPASSLMARLACSASRRGAAFGAPGACVLGLGVSAPVRCCVVPAQAADERAVDLVQRVALDARAANRQARLVGGAKNVLIMMPDG